MLSAIAPQPTPTGLADQQAEDAQYYRRVLHGLIDQGADLASAAHRLGTSQGDGETQSDAAAARVCDATTAFDRVSRAVRRTVALARKVAEPLRVHTDSRSDRAAARRRILRDVQDAIQHEAGDADAEALEAELHERLDAPELEDEIDGRPTAEIVTDICRDLGLGTLLGNHPWKRRTPPDIAALCARAKLPPGGQPGADQAGREPWPSATYYVPDRPKPPPYSEAGAIELMHQLLELRPPRIRGP